jgi:two-component system CheB/CheR fusion protein
VERLRPLLRTSLAGDGDSKVVTLEAVNRRGKAIRCEIRCTPLRGPNGDIHGAIVLMEETIDGRR